MNRVYGIFDTFDEAELAVGRLRNADYSIENMSTVMKEDVYRLHRGSDLAENVAGSAVTGATTGGLVGALAGLLVGIGAITIPGIGALLIGGPLATALGLTGAAATTVSGAATGAAAGGIVGALTGLGLPEYTARSYQQRIEAGGVLVSVNVLNDDEKNEVKSILSDVGAEDVYVQ